MAIVIPVTDSLASNRAKLKSSPRRFAERSVILRLAGPRFAAGFTAPLYTRGKTHSFHRDQRVAIDSERRADADDLSRMRDVAMIKRFRANGYLVPVPVSTRYWTILQTAFSPTIRHL